MDYIPNKESELLVWAQNYKSTIPSAGVSLGLTPTEISDEQTLCDNLINSINNVQAAKAATASAIALKNEELQTSGGALRLSIGRHKKAVTYTTAIGESLKIVSSTTGIDVANYKAKISVEKFASYVRIKFVKQSADGVNIYHRKKGESTWKFLARDTKSPYDDHIVLAISGQPEHWEYKAFGVINDDEIGQASDIVEVVFGG
jgi:hypothetical protein